MKKYANAKDILPKELYEKVKSHFTGILYIPNDHARDPSRSKIVVRLAKENASTKEIAAIMNISSRRVNQILASKRKRKVEYIWDE